MRIAQRIKRLLSGDPDPAVLAMAAAPQQTRGRPSSRRSWNASLGYDFGKTIAEPVDLKVYDVIVGAMPFVDRALRTLARMIAPFEVTCDNDSTADALNQWLEEVQIGYLLHGFPAFARSHIRQVLQYGKSAGEVVLAPSKRDIQELHIVSSKRIQLIKDDEHGLLLGEKDAIGRAVPYEAQDLFTYTAFNNEGDNPHGTSLLRSLPFVANILLRMENAMRQMIQRTGAPSVFIHAKFPSDGSVPDDKLSDARTQMENDWYDSQKARWNEEGIMDFVAATQADVDFRTIGADIHELAFEPYSRMMQEQIVSATELAPFMLGIQWSTTERLSQEQADMIVGMVADIRAELRPDFLHILDWVQRVRGLRGNVDLAWAEVNLRDRTETAKAELTEAQAQKVRQETAMWAWANGWTDQVGAKALAGYEDDEIAVPLDLPVLPGGGSGGGLAEHAELQWQQYP